MDEIAKLKKELARYKRWVADLQSGMYINCVYCGHRYGPEDKVPASMAEVLKKHIEKCPEHPMSALKAKNEEMEKALNLFLQLVDRVPAVNIIVTEQWENRKERTIWFKTYAATLKALGRKVEI